jgi:hypothetical protein
MDDDQARFPSGRSMREEEQRRIAHCSHSRAHHARAALLAKPSGVEGFGMSQKSRTRAIFPARNWMSSPSSWLNSIPVVRAVKSI